MEDATTVIAKHAAFLTDQGVPIDPSSQSIPYYVGCPKMHKDPVDMRFISSSASSSMKSVSVWINRALNGMQQVVNMLFADSVQSIGITTPWAARSWILNNAGDMLSLFERYCAGCPALHLLEEHDGCACMQSGDEFMIIADMPVCQLMYPHIHVLSIKGTVKFLAIVVFKAG